MKFNLNEVLQQLGARPLARDGAIAGWSIDSRTTAGGDLYFALRGEVHDGHEFVQAAFEKGAVAAVVEREVQAAGLQIPVPNSLAALQQLAANARTRWAGRVVGVTGSAGKTSTKDAIAALLSTEIPVGKTEGNFNNHIGLPLSILRLPDNAKAAVVEMGMNHAGEIRGLAQIAKPDIGVVTNVGYAHLEFFDSIDGITLAKRELIEALPREGTAVLNADDPRVAAFARVHRGPVVTYGFSESANVRAEEVGDSRFRCLGVEFETQLAGRHAISNILAGIAVAGIFGIPPSRLTDAVRALAPGSMRGERTVHDGITILNDCYNSNPAAARSMIDVLRDVPARRRIAVLGEMLELGDGTESLHRDLGKYVAESGIDVLITIRGAARF
ncbi:MAG: UDP-N-acetylmuramoyl-tripeptide--D-alanyl-D-alanine ligase, partial [Bryobacterales bacterium]|nr:UDP-N-acetylmuramoyl-tripeptide--D-alanyl-D-alanine ligase [Bryobacterales bacterium]